MTNVMTEIIKSAQRQSYEFMRKAAMLEYLLGPTIAKLPDDIGSKLPTSMYSYYVNRYDKQVDVTISLQLNEDLPFTKRMAPVAEFFHAFNVKKRERHVDEAYGAVSYKGTVKLTNTDYTLKLTIETGKLGLPPTCHIEEEEVTETVTRTRYRSVCEEPAASHAELATV